MLGGCPAEFVFIYDKLLLILVNPTCSSGPFLFTSLPEARGGQRAHSLELLLGSVREFSRVLPLKVAPLLPFILTIASVMMRDTNAQHLLVCPFTIPHTFRPHLSLITFLQIESLEFREDEQLGTGQLSGKQRSLVQILHDGLRLLLVPAPLKKL